MPAPMAHAADNRFDPGATAAARPRALIDRRFAPLYAMAATGVAFLIVAVAFSDFGYAHDPLDAVAILLVGLVGIGMAARWLTVPIVPDLAETIALFAAFSVLAPLCAALLAATGFPLADPHLSAFEDRKSTRLNSSH